MSRGPGTRTSLPDGSERFAIRKKLGAGGMGVVYQAFDRQRGIDLALKSLSEEGARALYRFKREFRSLADVAHPNLVTLYELHTVGEQWFFTMELVRGEPFVEHVRPLPPGVALTTTEPSDGGATMTTPTTVRPGLTTDESTRRRRERIEAGALDRARLEPALAQLVDAVHALHRVGKLHRDLKPSNVLVEASGRVVVLDFGLASDKQGIELDRTHELCAVGTPAYMSPEQAADQPLTEASDWYSVGVMLYEALTGQRPFEGAGREVVVLKQREEPPPPSAVAPGVPDDLARLCMQLLALDPARRPTGAELLRALGREPSPATEALARRGRPVPFVGRAGQLAALDEAFARARDGKAAAVFVRGPSGMGKTALVREFLTRLPERADDAVILEGRCYERESVPYKALDSIVDALSRQLLSLPADEVVDLVPREVVALTRLFPVLRRVPAIAEPATLRLQPPDPHELRRRAFGALRVLLARLAERYPVVLFVDDLQWGGVDSAAFLTELILHPGAPAMLTIASYRADEEDSPLLTALRGARDDGARTGAVTEVSVGAITTAESEELIRDVGVELAPDKAAALIREASGNPFLLVELAQLAAERSPLVTGDTVTLELVIRRRIDALPEIERALLVTCSVAGRPLAQDLLVRAAGATEHGTALPSLEKQRLIRIGQSGVEPYHDRIREAAVAGLAPEHRRAIHGVLARTLEAEPDTDPEWLVEHWLGAGQPGCAGRRAVDAAEAAEATLAFNRAADLYRLALRHHDGLDDDGRRTLTARMGHALTNAGRLDAAAAAFAEAAKGADPRTALELGRFELEQILRCGHLEQGIAKAREVLAAVGLSLPANDRNALLSIIWHRLRIRLHGTSYEPKREQDVDPEVLQRLDVCWSVSSAVAFINPFVGRALQMRFLRDALAVGEEKRAVMAMGLELGYMSLAGAKMRDKSEALCARTLEAASKLPTPGLRGFVLGGAGLSSFLNGQWQEASDRLIEAMQIMRDHFDDMRWEIDLCQIFHTSVLVYMGEMGELCRLVPLYVREAEERGDVYAARGLKGWRANLAWLAMGRPTQARANLDEVATALTGAFHLHHYYELLARSQIELYERDDPYRTWLRVERHWRDMVRAHLLRVQTVRVEANYLRARVGIAAARGPDAAKALASAERAARALDRERLAWTAPLAAAARAAIAHTRGHGMIAREQLAIAAAGFQGASMRGFEAAARWRLGALLGGDEGATELAAAKAWCEHNAIHDPGAFLAMLLPGFE